MRVLNVLFVPLLAIILCSAALAQMSEGFDQGTITATAESGSPVMNGDMTRVPLKRSLTLSKDDYVCLKLRTYVVRRVDPESDITRLHSYSTCQPAWKFETRSAVQKEIVPGDRRLTY
jgi:hypothetical protein